MNVSSISLMSNNVKYLHVLIIICTFFVKCLLKYLSHLVGGGWLCVFFLLRYYSFLYLLNTSSKPDICTANILLQSVPYSFILTGAYQRKKILIFIESSLSSLKKVLVFFIIYLINLCLLQGPCSLEEKL